MSVINFFLLFHFFNCWKNNIYSILLQKKRAAQISDSPFSSEINVILPSISPVWFRHSRLSQQGTIQLKVHLR
jgi:hypothetical protein